MTELQNSGGCKGSLEVTSFSPQEENKIRKHRQYNKKFVNNWVKNDNSIERGIDGQVQDEEKDKHVDSNNCIKINVMR